MEELRSRGYITIIYTKEQMKMIKSKQKQINKQMVAETTMTRYSSLYISDPDWPLSKALGRRASHRWHLLLMTLAIVSLQRQNTKAGAKLLGIKLNFFLLPEQI